MPRSLSKNSIGSEGAAALAPGIATSTSVTSVNLLSNMLEDESATMLLKIKAEKPMLRTLCGLTFEENEIDLRYKGLVPADAMILAPEIASIASLTSLSVASNHITGKAAQELAATVLAKTTLEHFSGIPLTELRADRLTKLDLSRKGLGVPEAIVLARLMGSVSGSLTVCNLQFNPLGAEGWKAIFTALRDSKVSKISTWDLDGERGIKENIKSLSAYISVSTSLTTVCTPAHKPALIEPSPARRNCLPSPCNPPRAFLPIFAARFESERT